MYTFQQIESIVEKGVQNLVQERDPRNIYDPVNYMMTIGGKRIRPKLCMIVYNLFSDNFTSEVINPALGIEMFHEFTLVHDDIMDRSDTRRGRPTVYRKWNENIAILSGDVMSILAHRLVSTCSAEVYRKAMDLFTTTAAEVCEGQQYDMDYENEPLITMDEYLKMIGLKTAVLIACAAKMGAVLAGAPDKVCNALYDYGYQLGIAFQITDDYLDTFGDEKVFGKKIGGDIANNKKSWLLVTCFRKALGEDKKRLSEIMSMGDDSRAEKVAAMQELYVRLGVKDEAEQAMQTYYQKALDALAPAAFDEARTAQLKLFADELLHREK